MVEELIQGEQFGTEIHGIEGRYSVLPPIAFSVNKDGITDPLNSVKFGPVTDPAYHFEKVQEKLLNMAQTLKFEGTVQVDLVYRNGEWFIIEINPRWSGMTTTTAAKEGRNPRAIFVDSILGTDKNYSMKRNLKYALNFKMKARTQEELVRLYENPHVDYIMQLETTVTGMEKINYCEVVISTDQGKEDILNVLNEFWLKQKSVCFRRIRRKGIGGEKPQQGYRRNRWHMNYAGRFLFSYLLYKQQYLLPYNPECGRVVRQSVE